MLTHMLCMLHRNRELPACFDEEEFDNGLTDEELDLSSWALLAEPGETRFPKMDFVYKSDKGNTPLKNHVMTHHMADWLVLTQGVAPHANARLAKKRVELPGGIEQFFKSAKRVKKTSHRATVFLKLLTLLIVLARLPFRIVLHPLFKALIWFLDPTIPFPTRADITQRYLPAFVDECTAHVTRLLGTTDGVTVTFDLWMSKKTDDILSLDAHFISDDWQWRHQHLGLVAMNGVTSGVVIAAKLRELLDRFHLKGKLFAAVFDGGANLQTARAELSRLHHMDGVPACEALQNANMYFTSCLAHLVNGACNSAVLLVRGHQFKVSYRHLLVYVNTLPML